jgi:putative ABC transport system substrate-binding protein
LIAALGGATVAWPLAARAQQPTMPVIGYLGPGALESARPFRAAFLDGLVETGYVEGRNVAVEYRWAEDQYDRLPELAGELVRRQVAVIVTAGATPTALAAKASTETIPIVFVLLVLNASSQSEIEMAFTTLVEQRAGALLVSGEPLFFGTARDQLVALAARHAVPTIYQYMTAADGLMSYGSRLADGFHIAGVYSGRILRGEKPADLPVQQSTRVELAINLKTAKTLGLTIPTSLLARADEVIE